MRESPHPELPSSRVTRTTGTRTRPPSGCICELLPAGRGRSPQSTPASTRTIFWSATLPPNQGRQCAAKAARWPAGRIACHWVLGLGSWVLGLGDAAAPSPAYGRGGERRLSGRWRRDWRL